MGDGILKLNITYLIGKLSVKLMFLLALISISSFLNAAQKNNQTKSVTLQLKWKHQFQFAGYYAAVEKGFYRELGLNVKLIEAIDGQNPSKTVLEGNADFGISDSDILLMRSQGKNVVVLAAIFQHSAQILLASKKSGITNVRDLIGKRIALIPKAIDIDMYLSDEGITADKIIIEKQNIYVDALLENKTDVITAYSTNEPFILQNAGFDYTIISPMMGGVDFYGDVLFTTNKLIENDAELVENFRKASLKGWKYAMDNSDEIVEIIFSKYSKRNSKEHLKFEAERMENLIMPNVVELGYSNPKRWESILNIYKIKKIVDPSFTIKGLLYSDYIKVKQPFDWGILIVFICVMFLVGSVTYYYYYISKKLKSEIKQRINIQKELERREEQFRTIVENTGEGICIVDKDEQFIFANYATEELLGVELGKLVGMNMKSFVSADAFKLLREETSQRIKGNKNVYELEILRLNGEKRNILVTAVPQFDKEKLFIGAFGVFRDITSHKQAEAKLKNEQLLLRAIIDNIPDAVYSKDLNCKKTLANLADLNNMGKTSEAEVIDRDDFDFYPKEIAEKFYADDQTVLQLGKFIINREEYVLDEKQQKRWLISSKIPLRDKDDKIIGLVGIGRDITELKNLEEEKRIRWEQLALQQKILVETATSSFIANGDIKNLSHLLTERVSKYMNIERVSVWQFDETETLLLCIDLFTLSNNKHNSGSVLREYEFKNEFEALKNSKYVDASEPYTDSRTTGYIETYLKPNKITAILDGVIRYSDKTLGVFCLEHVNKAHQWTTEEITFVSQLSDQIALTLSNQKRIKVEGEIITTNERLKKINSEKDKFFSIIAHDLRSPFQGFLGLTEYLAEDSNSFTPEELSNLTKEMFNSASSLYKLLQNLLEWTQIQRGTINFAPQALNLFNIIVDNIDIINQTAIQKEIEILNNIPESQEIFADKKMIDTVFRNLLSNAVKFTKKDGKIIIESKETGNHFLEISIADNGIGMSEQLCNKLFKMDEKVGRIGTDKEPSTGLGLLLCKEFVEKNNGKIWVESEENKGSKFHFTLPKINITLI